MESFVRSYKRILKTTEPPVVTGPLTDYWVKSVSELCELKDPWVPTPEWEERHRIYAHLLMALVYHYWNGYKYGRPKSDGDYPLNYRPTSADPDYVDGSYYGHNIAALAVDHFGYVLDFDFNHNDLFNSSAEHAEARLVRRLYSLAQVSDAWGVLPETLKERRSGAPRGSERRRRAAQHLRSETARSAAKEDDVRRATLSGVTIYTSLESCAQCAGVMALAQIQQVIYLQTDPQFFFIGRILRNLTTDRGRAPLPISAAEFHLPFFAELDRKFRVFAQAQDAKQGEPFYRGGTEPHWSSSISSFLCTTTARDIFKTGGDALNDPLRYEEFDGAQDGANAPLTAKPSMVERKPLSNAEVRVEALDFLDYARRKGLRGTPHNL